MEWIEPKQIPLARDLAPYFSDKLIIPLELAKLGLKDRQTCNAFLNPNEYIQTSPLVFADMEKTVQRIQDAIRAGETISIWGDFDVDGQTSTAILKQGLELLGGKIIFHVPVRKDESHGIQLDALKRFLTKKPSLIITCDTGITDTDSVNFASNHGVDVIITDHHTPNTTLPTAFSIINPHLLPSKNPLSHLAGVGTAFQVLRALNEKAGNGIDLNQFLDLVALGTIADIAVLRGENRFYAQRGIEKMNNNLRPALEAILNLSTSNPANIDENTIGFQIAPLLNAAGRLGDANQIIPFLISNDPRFCKKTAAKLENLNTMRKIAVNHIFSSAMEMIKGKNGDSHPMIILAKQGWEKGVLGIACSKLVEIFNKPVILLSIENKTASGSARSIEGFNIIDAIQKQRLLLTQFGGHPGAAGLSMPIDNLDGFTCGMNQTIAEHSGLGRSVDTLQIDHYIELHDINRKIFDELSLLAPFGQGNPPPIFATKDVEIAGTNTIGRSANHLQLSLRGSSGTYQKGIMWNSSTPIMGNDGLDIAYQIKKDYYGGHQSHYLEIIDTHPHTRNIHDLDRISINKNIKDHRMEIHQENQIEKILQKEKVLCWYEGLHPPAGIVAVNRNEIFPAQNLAILVPPPSRIVLQTLLEKTNASSIFLFSLSHRELDIRIFINQLGGLIKYCINHSVDTVTVPTIAARLCLTEQIIMDGLEWYKSTKGLSYTILEQTISGFEFDGEINKIHASPLQKKIIAQINEIRAFREYYLRAAPGLLIKA